MTYYDNDMIHYSILIFLTILRLEIIKTLHTMSTINVNKKQCFPCSRHLFIPKQNNKYSLI